MRSTLPAYVSFHVGQALTLAVILSISVWQSSLLILYGFFATSKYLNGSTPILNPIKTTNLSFVSYVTPVALIHDFSGFASKSEHLEKSLKAVIKHATLFVLAGQNNSKSLAKV